MHATGGWKTKDRLRSPKAIGILILIDTELWRSVPLEEEIQCLSLAMTYFVCLLNPQRLARIVRV